KKMKFILNMFNLSSLILMILSLISPIFDQGNIVFICFAVILIICLLAEEMNIKVYATLAEVVLTVLMVYYISMFGVIKYIDITRTNYIKEQIESKELNIEVKANPIFLVYEYNPNFISETDFKKYYEIPDDCTIEVKYFGIFEKIEKKVKN
ncbi:MAG: hypothetical protein IKN09_01070, partial [Clostridia bacterium]|nr:hypothetical protein [Clostridia bacterium]